jgi:ubiquinol oxidase
VCVPTVWCGMALTGGFKNMTVAEWPDSVLAAHVPRPGLMPRFLFWLLDFVYGPETTYPKIAALELLARQPYEAWRHAAFAAVTHTVAGDPDFATKVLDQAEWTTTASDNETYHLIAFHELARGDGHRLRFWKDKVIPNVLAWTAFHQAFLMYVVRPKWSYKLNYDFEAHAAQVYARFLLTAPDSLLDQPWESVINTDEHYGEYVTLREFVTRVMIDEVEHRDDSLKLMNQGRFGS